MREDEKKSPQSELDFEGKRASEEIKAEAKAKVEEDVEAKPGLLFVSASPHIRDDVSVPRIMYSVVIALLPALIGAVYFFGARALWLILIAVVTSVVAEALMQKVMHRPITVSDGSAIITGMLLSFNLPGGVPMWMPIVGSVFAIAIGKMVFGGLGYNPLNPALLGRAFLLASWPAHMTTDWTPTITGTMTGFDTVTKATPLGVLQEAHRILADPAATVEKMAQAKEAIEHLSTTYGNLFWGNVSGCIGETSVILLLLGAGYLLYKKFIDWRIPLFYIATVALLTWILGGTGGAFSGDPLFHILAGGLILGAFFMATDMVTTPVTVKGRYIFGLGCGVLTVVIRLWGGYPEGVSYSILFMNAFTPLIDRWTKPRRFGA
ncbi:MAG: RnfABCDGE type electron transport complex subunit D [Gemmatimonadota bacterium]|nr:MAG: RnfABCDGE type electron transport complex subunit D [Gemmatimonadota bacterium]